MLFFGKKSEYEIIGQTFVEIMGILNSKTTIEIEEITKVEGYNVYFLSLIFCIIESGIIKSKYQLSKIDCNMFGVNDLVEYIYASDFYKKNIKLSFDFLDEFVSELSIFIYENLIIYYDRFIKNNVTYISDDKERKKKIKLIEKGAKKALKNNISTEANKFVRELSTPMYNYSKHSEKEYMKDIVIGFLENIQEK